MTNTYEITAVIRIRVEANRASEARDEIRSITDQIARILPTGATFKHADPSEAVRI